VLEGDTLTRVWEKTIPHLRPTVLLSSPRLDEALGPNGPRVAVATETFQHTGSFKLRAATAVTEHARARRLLTASSGNFGAALARAAARAGLACTVVMPAQSARVKIDSVRRFGAEVDLIDTTVTSRAARLAELAAADPEAQVVSPYDDPYVVAGNATLGAEIFAAERPDVVVTPVGGGGLASGLAVARDRLAPSVELIGAEPRLANDAARSLRSGTLCSNEGETGTICDGARTVSLGALNFAILRDGMADVLEVDDAVVVRALRLLFEAVNLKVEPTGALAIAAVLQAPERFAGKRVVCVVSGGNVDRAAYARWLGDG
jgi:threonine dehydratase